MDRRTPPITCIPTYQSVYTIFVYCWLVYSSGVFLIEVGRVGTGYKFDFIIQASFKGIFSDVKAK